MDLQSILALKHHKIIILEGGSHHINIMMPPIDHQRRHPHPAQPMSIRLPPMDPADRDCTTGRAPSKPSTLHSLPMYDQEFWGEICSSGMARRAMSELKGGGNIRLNSSSQRNCGGATRLIPSFGGHIVVRIGWITYQIHTMLSQFA